MRYRTRAMTMTELLVVMSVITILASMMSPVLVRAQKEAVRRGCVGNMKQIHLGLELCANSNFGKLPRCFDVDHPTNLNAGCIESSWWYRKVARTMYPYDSNYDQLTAPRSDDSFWTNPANATTNLQKFRAERSILRCPASPDPPDDRVAHSGIPRCGDIDKDRVYDDNYGYNNLGLEDRDGLRAGFYYGTYSAIPDRSPTNIPGVTTDVYHTSGAITGQYIYKDGRYTPPRISRYYSYIGGIGDFVDAAGTVLLMDYIKADAAPFPGRDGLRGYPSSFSRHGGRANVLFVDGHVEGYRKRTFLLSVGGPSLHWQVKRRP